MNFCYTSEHFVVPDNREQLASSLDGNNSDLQEQY